MTALMIGMSQHVSETGDMKLVVERRRVLYNVWWEVGWRGAETAVLVMKCRSLRHGLKHGCWG